MKTKTTLKAGLTTQLTTTTIPRLTTLRPGGLVATDGGGIYS